MKHSLKTILNILLASVMLVGMVGGAVLSPAAAIAHRASQEVVTLWAQAPQREIAVIVQQADRTGMAIQEALQTGARITHQWSFINAFAARMPAEAAYRLSASPGVRWVSVDAAVHESVGTMTSVSWASLLGSATANGFTNSAAMIDSGVGANGTFGSGGAVKGAFGGFTVETSPENRITTVEVLLNAYVPALLGSSNDPTITVYLGGRAIKSYVVNHHDFETYLGQANAGTVVLNITSAKSWTWADFDNYLEIQIDQTKFASGKTIYYDAIGLRVTSQYDSAASAAAMSMQTTTTLPSESVTSRSTADEGMFSGYGGSPVNAAALVNSYNYSIRAVNVWNEGPWYLQGQDVAVAVVDSGIFRTRDLAWRLVRNVNFNSGYHGASDKFGHGTHVAGIIAGDGTDSGGQYIGVAPKTDLVNIRVSDDNGMSYESDVVDSLEWIYYNQYVYNIRIVNLSLNSSVAQSYHTSPLDAACEILWFNGVVVVVSAGNNGGANNLLYPPANDPFVITVGAVDDKGTGNLADDAMASFSASGAMTEAKLSGGTFTYSKPDLVAPGRNIVSLLPDNRSLTIGVQHPNNRVNTKYFRMSGTSMAAPMVSGAAALLLQSEPYLNPDQVKYRLTATANKSWAGYNATKAGAGTLDIYAAVHATNIQASANTGKSPSQMLTTGTNPITWGTAGWNSAGWNSAGWNSAGWNSAGWNSAGWNSDYWEP
jgi:serine protease AprX